MNKYVLGIDGMGCGSCEAHVKDVIRRNFQYKKVIASHIKNQLIESKSYYMMVERESQIQGGAGR